MNSLKLLCFSISIFLVSACNTRKPADLIILGGKIYTVDEKQPVVEAVAVVVVVPPGGLVLACADTAASGTVVVPKKGVAVAVDLAIATEATAAGGRGPGPNRQHPAAADAENPRLTFVSASAATALGRHSGWASAPAWDPDHPEESAYRPFPLAPFLTMSAGGEAAAAHFVRPDFLRMAELFDPSRVQVPLRLRPGRHVAKLIWAEDATSAAVPVSRLGSEDRSANTAVALHRVRTQEQPRPRR